MKRPISLFVVLIFILAACAPAADPTTPQATASPISTATFLANMDDGVHVSPEFATLAESIESEGYTLSAVDGVVEHNGEPVPNVLVTADGQLIVMVGDVATPIDSENAHFTADGLEIDGLELDENDEWVEAEKTYTVEQIKDMTEQEKIDVAPDIEGYTTLRTAERYVIYQNEFGVRDVAYDMVTGEQVEIPQYKICNPEVFYNCEVSQEDLTSGRYWLWLNTLDVKFDPDGIKDVPIVLQPYQNIGWVQAQELYHDSGPNMPADFADPTTAPFDRDVTSGVVLYNENNVKSFGILRPVAFYDELTQRVNWVVALQSHFINNEGYDTLPRSPKHQQNYETWRYHYNVTPLMTNSYSVITGLPDPLLSESYVKYPDIDQRFKQFAAGDMSALSAPGLVVQTQSMSRPQGHNQYK